MDERELIEFEDNDALRKLLRIGNFAPWNHPSSRYWDLGNDALYQLCEIYPLPPELVNVNDDKSKDEAAFATKLWLIGRSYAASPERYSYYYKKDDEKKGGKPKEVDNEGYESFFDDITKILFRGACYYRGKHIGIKDGIDNMGVVEAEKCQERFGKFLKKVAGLRSAHYGFMQPSNYKPQKTEAEFKREIAELVVDFASLLKRARYVRDLGVVARNPKDKKGEKGKEQVPPELENQSFPLSFSSKFLHFHIPQLFFIYDSISASNLRVGYKRNNSVTIALEGKKIIEVPKEMSESTNAGGCSDDHYERYFEHVRKEYRIAASIYYSLDKDTRDYLYAGKYEKEAAELPIYYYLTRMVDALVTNATNDGRTCCFTGHRPGAFPWGEDESDERFCALMARINAEVDRLIAHGAQHFICGNALGVDTWAAEVVLAKRAEHPGIKLEIAVPFAGHNADSDRARAVQERADAVRVISSAADKVQAYDERNRYMVDRSDIVVAVFNERAAMRGGTARTVAYAREQQKEIIQIRWTEF